MTTTSGHARGLCVLVYLGLFGIAFSCATIFSTLPANAEGTCGPSSGSETAAEALFEPGSIGAGAEPAASHTAALKAWHDFVDSCQSATDDRAAVAFPVGIISLGLVVVPLVLILRRRSRTGSSPGDEPASGPGAPGSPSPDDRPLVGVGAPARPSWPPAEPPTQVRPSAPNPPPNYPSPPGGH